jgi:hypothetical protein
VRVGRYRDSAERGVVATEFIILLPIFLTLVFGMVWAGTTLFRWMNLELAAREGARFAAILPPDFPNSDPDPAGEPSVAWFDAVLDRVEGVSAGASTICVAYVGRPGSQEAEENNVAPIARSYERQPNGTTAPGSGTCFVDNRSATSRRVQVEVTGPVPLQGFGFWSGTLRGDATARFEAVYPRE